jgi:muramoyltetrapeptide carboxypeptidase
VSFAAVPRLKPGDPVAVAAPAGPFERDVFARGLAVLQKRYQTLFDDGIFEKDRYLAGNDARRLTEVKRGWEDDRLKAVFIARGGYGAMRLLDRLRFDAAKTKPLIGFSDVTALHCALQTAGVRSLHGAVVTQLGRQKPDAQQRLFDLLESPNPPDPLHAKEMLVPGTVEGPLLGGNLSVLTRLIGTPYLPSLKGAVLLLEDVGERPYRLDRMWTHLKLAGVFSEVAGIALGTFQGCEEKDADYTSTQVLADLARDTGLPCAHGFPVGHDDDNQPVPLGAKVRLDASMLKLEFLEGLVS